MVVNHMYTQQGRFTIVLREHNELHCALEPLSPFGPFLIQHYRNTSYNLQQRQSNKQWPYSVIQCDTPFNESIKFFKKREITNRLMLLTILQIWYAF